MLQRCVSACTTVARTEVVRSKLLILFVHAQRSFSDDMNRNNKLKPLAPRPVQDRSLQHMTSYASSSAGVPDGHAGSIINSNAFAGANLGVHASPLEAVTSMDPKDYVWGGGYNASFQEYQQPAYPAYGEPYCYPQAQAQGCMYNMQYGQPFVKSH